MYSSYETRQTLIILGFVGVLLFLYIVAPAIIYEIGEKIADIFHNDQIKDKDIVFAQSGRLADRYKHLQPQNDSVPANDPPVQTAVQDAAKGFARRKFCPYCGTENEYHARFCYSCGSAIPDPDEQG